MATNIKCTAFFGSDDGWGWSETHHKAVSVEPSNLLPVLTSFKALVDQFRVPMLGKDRYVVGLRVAYGTRATGIKSSPYWYEPPRYPGNQREGSSPHVAAKARFGEAGNQKFSDVYVRGFWDAVEKDEQLDFTTSAGAAWKALADQWVAALVQGQYGWLGTNEAQTIRGLVPSYTIQPTGEVRFTLDPKSGPALPAVGTVLTIRVSKLNNSNSVLNTTHVVQVIDATTVQTMVPTAALLGTGKGSFVITRTDFFLYTGVQYWKLAKRKAGAPFGHTPGRSKARAKG